MADIMTALFDNEAAAENAAVQIKNIGYGQNDVSIVMKSREATPVPNNGQSTSDTVHSIGAPGSVLGATLAGLLALGTVAHTRSGLIAAGPAAAELLETTAEGGSESLTEWLLESCVPDEVVPYYERGLEEGGVMIAVSAHPGDEEKVREILHSGAVSYGGVNMPSHVAPGYAESHTPIPAPPRAYDSTTAQSYSTAIQSPELQRTVNTTNAEDRAEMQSASDHERDSRRDIPETTATTPPIPEADPLATRTD